MFPFELTILGSSSATPTSSRHPTAQILNHNNRFFLIDCGEATQIQLRRFKFKLQRIDHIFISHLHGDHFLGLPGLLGSMHLLGREKALHLYSPPGLEEIIKVTHFHSKTFLKYKVVFHTIENETSNELLFENNMLRVETIPMNHRIPCYGFLFKEKKMLRNITKEKLAEYSIPTQAIQKIKEGSDFITEAGITIRNSELTTPPPTPRTYAYCSDTLYNETELFVAQISNTNLLYHEATFGTEMIARAKATHHSTAQQAATVAKKANANRLIIGHYSARYKDLAPLLLEAQKVFSNTVLATEGETYAIC